MFSSHIINKLTYMLNLIVTTSYYGWIIVLQILSGFFSIAGIPLLIPVLEYIRTDSLQGANYSYLEYFEKVFIFVGIEPSFYAILAVASVFVISGQFLMFVSTIIARFAQLKLSGRYREALFSSYLDAKWLWLTKDKSGEMNHAIIREADLASVAHLDSQRIVICLIQVITFLYLAINLSFAVTLLAFIVYGILFFINSKNANHIQKLSESYNEMFKRLSSSTANYLQNKKFFKSSLVHEGFMGKMFCYVNEIIRLIKVVNLREQVQIFWTFSLTFAFLIGLIMFHPLLHVGFPELLVTNGLF